MRNVGIAIIVISVGAALLLGFARRSDPDRHGQADTNTVPQSLPTQKEVMGNLSLVSASFTEGGVIPLKHTCDGANINPPLIISGVPKEAKSLALIMDDPDVPKDRRPDGLFVHWVRFNIPSDTMGITEGEEPAGIAGAGTSGDKVYRGPCPPDREHRYFFKLYALDTELTLPEGSTKEEVEAAMEGHIMARGELMGRYDRKR